MFSLQLTDQSQWQGEMIRKNGSEKINGMMSLFESVSICGSVFQVYVFTHVVSETYMQQAGAPVRWRAGGPARQRVGRPAGRQAGQPAHPVSAQGSGGGKPAVPQTSRGWHCHCRLPGRTQEVAVANNHATTFALNFFFWTLLMRGDPCWVLGRPSHISWRLVLALKPMPYSVLALLLCLFCSFAHICAYNRIFNSKCLPT